MLKALASSAQGLAGSALQAMAGAVRLVASIGIAFCLLELALILAGADSAYAHLVLAAQRQAEWLHTFLDEWFGEKPMLLAWVALVIGIGCFGPSSIAAWVPRLRRAGAALRSFGTVLTLVGSVGLFGAGASDTLQQVRAEILTRAEGEKRQFAEAQAAIEQVVVRAAASEILERARRCDDASSVPACDFVSPWSELRQQRQAESAAMPRRSLTREMDSALHRIGEAPSLSAKLAGWHVFELDKDAVLQRRAIAGQPSSATVQRRWNESEIKTLRDAAAQRGISEARGEILELVVGIALNQGSDDLRKAAAGTALGSAADVLLHPLLAEPMRAALGEISRAVLDRTVGWDTPALALAWAAGEARRAVASVSGLAPPARQARNSMLAATRDLARAAAKRDREAVAALAALVGNAAPASFRDPGVAKAAEDVLRRAAQRARTQSSGQAAEMLAMIQAAASANPPKERFALLDKIEQEFLATRLLSDAADRAAKPLLEAEASSHWGALRQGMAGRVITASPGTYEAQRQTEALDDWWEARAKAARTAVLAESVSEATPNWEALFAEALKQSGSLRRLWLAILRAAPRSTEGTPENLPVEQVVRDWGRSAGLDPAVISTLVRLVTPPPARPPHSTTVYRRSARGRR